MHQNISQITKTSYMDSCFYFESMQDVIVIFLNLYLTVLFSSCTLTKNIFSLIFLQHFLRKLHEADNIYDINPLL